MSGCRYVGLIISTIVQMAVAIVVAAASGLLRRYSVADVVTCAQWTWLPPDICDQGWWPHAINVGIAVGAVASFAGFVSLILTCVMKRSSVAAMATALNVLATIISAAGGGFMVYVMTQHPGFRNQNVEADLVTNYRDTEVGPVQWKVPVYVDIAAMFVSMVLAPITIAAISSVRRAAERKEYDYERVFIPKH